MFFKHMDIETASNEWEWELIRFRTDCLFDFQSCQLQGFIRLAFAHHCTHFTTLWNEPATGWPYNPMMGWYNTHNAFVGCTPALHSAKSIELRNEVWQYNLFNLSYFMTRPKFHGGEIPRKKNLSRLLAEKNSQRPGLCHCYPAILGHGNKSHEWARSALNWWISRWTFLCGQGLAISNESQCRVTQADWWFHLWFLITHL